MVENQTNNELREAENGVVVEGILVENRIETGAKNNEEYIAGELDIETAENEVHTFRVYSKKLKKDGSENGVYKSLSTVMNEYKSIASVGREEADKVRITAGRIGVNEYYGQDDKLRSNPQLSTNFINRVPADEEFNPRAEFDVEVFIKGIAPEVKGDDETGRLLIDALIPVYGGRVIPFKFVVPSGDAADYVDGNYEAGHTVRLYGDIINFKEKKVELQKAAFGKDKEKVTYKTIREYLVTGGSEPYEEESVNVYDVELIKKALVEREAYLTEMKNKKDQPKQEEKKGGFGSKGGNNKTADKKDKKKLDLPF
jgi:hypothetical protein